MARIDTFVATAIDNVLARLREELGLSDANCYEVLDELHPIIPRGGDYWLTVALGESTFDVEHQIGGGGEQLTEYGRLIVTAYTRIKLDETGKDRYALHDVRRGLYSIRRNVQKVLVGHDLLDENGNTFLRQVLYLVSTGRPQAGSIDQSGSVVPVVFQSLYFGLDFDWDLS